ncbi:MAG TPA: dephospho-CoA kinase [Opitutaceae bacterium]|nr:dephospho-CoA kinase [Opitutaceae bacterium]
MIIGLTGGIGSGKSVAARIFEELGYHRIDSDELVKQSVLTDPAVVEAIGAAFGRGVVGPGGEIDRGALARIVFNDSTELLRLEEIVHPRLFVLWRKIIGEREAGPSVFEVPLLFEKALENWFDFTVCVATSSALQLARLSERGMSQALAQQRISKQLPLAQKIELADYVLLNDGSRDFLREQVVRLLDTIGSRR